LELLAPRTLKLANWTILALLVGLGYVWQGPQFGLGVLVGGLLVVFNFHWLHHNLKGLLEGPSRRARGPGGPGQGLFRRPANSALRGGAGGIISVAASRMGQYFGLVVGLSTTVLTLMAVAFIEMIKLNKKEANPSHGTSHSVS
jgi:hypothetical protein